MNIAFVFIGVTNAHPLVQKRASLERTGSNCKIICTREIKELTSVIFASLCHGTLVGVIRVKNECCTCVMRRTSRVWNHR